jgi:cytochrome c556
MLEMLARVSLDGFVAGSDEGDTKAKPDIWKEWPRFRALMEKYQGEVGRLNSVARNGQPAALKTAVEDLTRVCKSCHDDFKKSSVGN